MKRFIVLLFMIVFLLSSCVGPDGSYQGPKLTAPNPAVYDPTCKIYESEYGIDVVTTTSVVVRYIKNPCAARQLYLAFTRSYYVIQEPEKEEVIRFIDVDTRRLVRVGSDLNTLKYELVKLLPTAKSRAIVLTLGDIFIYIPPTAVLVEDDVKLLNGALDKMIAEIKLL